MKIIEKILQFAVMRLRKFIAVEGHQKITNLHLINVCEAKVVLRPHWITSINLDYHSGYHSNLGYHSVDDLDFHVRF